MVEPAKPFACMIPDCGMTFTNEDHLHVHTKKHDMILQLGAEQRASFVADQTPTPTRFIRNCEEVGLFQDLQNVTVNPFDEGFKRAMEAKQGVLSLDSTLQNDDVLHTPQMVYPMIEADTAVFSTNNQRNVIISRSSSDESGTLKEFKTTTISKLTNEVSTISTIVENRDSVDKISIDVIKNTQTQPKDNSETIFKNITVHSNVEIRKDGVDIEISNSNKVPVLIYTDTVIKDSIVTKDVLFTDHSKLTVDKIPIMSQKSLDLVVDSLTSDLNNDLNEKHVNDKTNEICSQTLVVHNETDSNIRKINEYPSKVHSEDNFTSDNTKYVNQNARNVRKTKLDTDKVINNNESKTEKDVNIKDDIEVIIKLPDGKKVHMKAVEDSKTDAREILRKTIESKKVKSNEIPIPKVANILPISGTLIPVTILNSTVTPITVTKNGILPKIPISRNPNVSISNIKELNVNINNVTKNLVTKLKNNSYLNKPNNSQKDVNNRNARNVNSEKIEERLQGSSSSVRDENGEGDEDDDCVIEKVTNNPKLAKRTRIELDSRSEASKRYRARLKDSMKKQCDENRLLRDVNQKLIAENAVLKLLVTEHMKKCPNADDLRLTQERLKNLESVFNN